MPAPPPRSGSRGETAARLYAFASERASGVRPAHLCMRPSRRVSPSPRPCGRHARKVRIIRSTRVGRGTWDRGAAALHCWPARGATLSLKPIGEPARSRLRGATHHDVLHLSHDQITGDTARAELERALNVARVKERHLGVRLRNEHGVREVRVASHGWLPSCSSSIRPPVCVGGPGRAGLARRPRHRDW
jgi:hypothetical protein